MASAARAASGSFMGASVFMLKALKGLARPTLLRLVRSIEEHRARRQARDERLRFVDWLASPEGPGPSPTLKMFKVRPATWTALWRRRLLCGQGNLPSPRR